MKTLLVADDHPVVLEGIRAIFEHSGFKVLKSTSAHDALSILESAEKIDIFVIDLSLKKGNDGLGLVKTLRERGCDNPIVIYTMHEELWNISSLFNADVQGIVLKGDSPEELVKAVKEVAGGKKYFSETVETRRQEALSTSGVLSQKDVEVLRLISEGLASRDIARKMCITEKGVEYHRCNILRKLNCRNMLEATRRAIALGIIY